MTSAPRPTLGNNFAFIRFYVRDIARSTALYTEAFGLHEERRLSPPTVPAVEIFLASDNPNASLIDLEERTDKAVMVTNELNAGSAILCIEVKDVAVATARAVELGAKLITQVDRVVWPDQTFTYSVVDDLDGNHIELIHFEDISK